MSEQTPNSSENLNGSDPSMEDILASIRKIISDDEPVAMESPEDVIAANPLDDSSANALEDLVQEFQADGPDLTSDAVLSQAEPIQSRFTAAEGESVDLNIDDILADLNKDVLSPEIETAAPEVASEAIDNAVPTSVLDDILSDASDVAAPQETPAVLAAEDDVLAMLDEEIPLQEDTAFEALGLMPELVEDTPMEAVEDFSPQIETPELSSADEMDDIDELLNGLLGDSDTFSDESETFSSEDVVTDVDVLPEVGAAPIAEKVSFDDPVDLEPEDAISADLTAEPAGVGDTEDLDLVKSLMADLADDTDGVETEEDLDALLSIPEVEETSAVSIEGDLEPEGDILGEILDMTIEDELETHPEDLVAEDVVAETAVDGDFESLGDVIAAEQENIAENAQLSEAVSSDEVETDDFPSLSEIAAAAEADAVAVETATVSPIAATAGAGALAGLAAVAVNAADDMPAITEDILPTDNVETDNIEIESREIESGAIEIEETPKSLSTQETEMPVKAVKTDAILDDVTEAATAGAFAELNQVVEDKAIFNERGPRIGDLVQEALRPMLKEWLDANLKGIVERAVTKEVKRISQGK